MSRAMNVAAPKRCGTRKIERAMKMAPNRLLLYAHQGIRAITAAAGKGSRKTSASSAIHRTPTK